MSKRLSQTDLKVNFLYGGVAATFLVLNVLSSVADGLDAVDTISERFQRTKKRGRGWEIILLLCACLSNFLTSFHLFSFQNFWHWCKEEKRLLKLFRWYSDAHMIDFKEAQSNSAQISALKSYTEIGWTANISYNCGVTLLGLSVKSVACNP